MSACLSSPHSLSDSPHLLDQRSSYNRTLLETNMPLKVACQFISLAKVNIYWLKSGKTLSIGYSISNITSLINTPPPQPGSPSSRDDEVREQIIYTTEIEIKSILKEDAGTYQCFAENRHGMAYGVWRVDVNCEYKSVLAPSNVPPSAFRIVH